ncbi:hypothetical protein PI125_g21154 [Phytophthora idaei]|nr:hypothetical protein PI125_g21154 [Phytophthora idaei]
MRTTGLPTIYLRGWNQKMTLNSDHHQRQNATADNDYELINDSNLSGRLRCCPGVDIFQPFGLRGNGYCEDAVAYAKYLDPQLLPM